jgi:serine/threonine protein kinase
LQIGLVHESIVRLLHFEPGDGRMPPYILMEYVSWVSGERWLAEAGLDGLPEHAVLSIGIKLCEALTCAHAASVLHGDIKPSNVFVDPGAERAKLADFGIARVIGTHEQHALVTRLAGTPAFMAPEQRTRGARLGPWTDVYSLARTLATFLDPLNALGCGADDDIPGIAQATVQAIRAGLAERPEERPRDSSQFRGLLSFALAAVA